MEKSKDARRWAIEQAILLHGYHGVTTDKVLSEANMLLAFVNATNEIEKSHDDSGKK